jgi:hypothetical protein
MFLLEWVARTSVPAFFPFATPAVHGVHIPLSPLTFAFPEVALPYFALRVG